MKPFKMDFDRSKPMFQVRLLEYDKNGMAFKRLKIVIFIQILNLII